MLLGIGAGQVAQCVPELALAPSCGGWVLIWQTPGLWWSWVWCLSAGEWGWFLKPSKVPGVPGLVRCTGGRSDAWVRESWGPKTASLEVMLYPFPASYLA